jgi:hypothetical protein
MLRAPKPGPAMSATLVLYRRASCQLCDHAEVALRDAGVAAFTTVEIGWEGELAERYGWRVPVLRDADSGRELDWPFDAWGVRAFVGSPGPAAS